MKINDKVKVVKQFNLGENYPWIPNLVGKTGKISEVLLEDEIEACYLVEMDESFEVDRPAENESAFGYEPVKSRMTPLQEWAFITEEIEAI